jgi:hypothetical protein
MYLKITDLAVVCQFSFSGLELFHPGVEMKKAVLGTAFFENRRPVEIKARAG